MKVLHICSNYFGSKVHKELCQSLDKNGLIQTVYSYFDGEDKIGKNEFNGLHTNFVFSNILNPFMRKIYPLKRYVVYKDLQKKIKIDEYSCTFATTLFSDGGIAYKLYKDLGIPYIVAVRNTDINYFMPHRIFWNYGQEILLNASKIIFISTAKIPMFREHGMIKPILNLIEGKITLRPNGINSFWLRNLNPEPHKNTKTICYVGIFSDEKNVTGLIDAVISLKSEFPEVQLNIIGGRGNMESEIIKKAAQSDCIHLLGYISDKQQLQKIYLNSSLFAMPSHHETFGLVYIEAMSQGLPVLYTIGEGIDGMFDKIGVAVNSKSVKSIANGIREIFNHYEDYSIEGKVNFDIYDWNLIAKQYINIFKEVKK